MKAHQLISDPRHFTRGTLARDSKGKPCGTDPKAKPVMFDALGAIFWCYPDGKHREPDKFTGKSPCERARELAHSKYGLRLGQLEHEEALVVFRELDV
jgi:hypothetical protein